MVSNTSWPCKGQTYSAAMWKKPLPTEDGAMSEQGSRCSHAESGDRLQRSTRVSGCCVFHASQLVSAASTIGSQRLKYFP